MALLGYASIAGSPIAALGGDTTILNVEAGAFVLTGQSVAITPAINANEGTFTLTGVDVFYATITAETGQFTVTVFPLPEAQAQIIDTRFSHDRGFEETLELFAQERRREREEREIEQLMAWESKLIAEALLPFVRP